MQLEYFQLIDRITDLNLDEKSITVEAQVPQQNTIFEGHFPGYPIMPGVLLIEVDGSDVRLAAARPYEIRADAVFGRGQGSEDARLRRTW